MLHLCGFSTCLCWVPSSVNLASREFTSVLSRFCPIWRLKMKKPRRKFHKNINYHFLPDEPFYKTRQGLKWNRLLRQLKKKKVLCMLHVNRRSSTVFCRIGKKPILYNWKGAGLRLSKTPLRDMLFILKPLTNMSCYITFIWLDALVQYTSFVKKRDKYFRSL